AREWRDDRRLLPERRDLRDGGLRLPHRRALRLDPLRARATLDHRQRLPGLLVLRDGDGVGRLSLVERLAAHRAAVVQEPRALQGTRGFLHATPGSLRGRARLRDLLRARTPLQLGEQRTG